MRTHVLIGALAAFLMVSCEGKSGTEQPSLEVSPEAMTFEAGSGTQQAAVTAQGVEWTHEVAAEAAEWLSAERSDDKTLTVTVAENPAPEQRSGRITVSAEGSGVAPCVITVTQQAADVAYGLTLEPAILEFAGEGAPAQTVTVVTQGGLTWTAEPEEAIAGWVTLAVEGDKITVTAADNPETAPRSGNIVVTPSVESVGQKAIRVVQTGKEVIPELSATPTELTFPCGDVTSEYTEPQTIQVTAVGTTWHLMWSIDNAGEWTDVMPNDTRDEIMLRLKRNGTAEPRTASLFIVPDNDELGLQTVEVKVTQEAAPEYRSNLTENVELKVTQLVSLIRPGQGSGIEGEGSYWTLTILGPDAEYNGGMGGGTGDRLYIHMASTLIEPNDDGVYELPEGTYTVATAEKEDKVAPGELIYPFNLNASAMFPTGTTYTRLENGTYTVNAPLVSGTMTVSRSGDTYTLQFDFKDDQGYTVTGTYEGPLNAQRA
ncbi:MULTISPECIES: BACON domain-containing protein [Rikenellaceae]|uniref:BACON domain-containing protein n=1 Tax=Rikenellaceae TaxID=171550 RepID=UPI000ADA910B|nr:MULTISPECIES: BACON domain-containing protein [Rikenellaceae]